MVYLRLEYHSPEGKIAIKYICQHILYVQVSGGQLPVVGGGGRAERRARSSHAAAGAQPAARRARARARAAAPPADAVRYPFVHCHMSGYQLCHTEYRHHTSTRRNGRGRTRTTKATDKSDDYPKLVYTFR